MWLRMGYFCSPPPRALRAAFPAPQAKRSVGRGAERPTKKGRPEGRRSNSLCRNSLLRRKALVRTIAPVGHELVELGLVLCRPQAVQEIAEFALLVLEPAERL